MKPDVKSETILAVKDLVVSFIVDGTTTVAVDRASLRLSRGETLGIVGESGCGKSVTAMAIMGLLPKPAGKVESGSIEFLKENLVTLSQEKMQKVRGKKISMIFQEPMTALNPVHRVGKQINEVFQLHFRGMGPGEIDDRAKDMLAKVGIPDPEKVLKAYPHQLSGGMRQRVMIAMALCAEPDILIADEPTTALDVTVQAQILELIKELQERMSMSVILITHDLGVIAENCDNAVVMYGGQVVERASVPKLFSNPSHPYTRGLLTSIPGLSSTPKTILRTIEGMVPSLEDMPVGCRFSTRCSLVFEPCRVSAPGQVRVDGEHYAACYDLERRE